MSIDRYPGPRSFESNEQAIFRGRTSEIKDLLDLIRLEQVLVLFSKSGLGKSSLLNAGVGPALPIFNHQPIRVRFQIFGTQSDINADATNTNPVNSTIEYITSEYSAAYRSLQKDLDTWQQEMAQLPTGHGEQQAKQAAELEQLIQQQLESLSAEHPLTDEKLAEFKQKQYEITDQPLTDTDRRVRLNNNITAATAALSLTTLSGIDQEESKCSPRITLDPFCEQAGGRLWETLKLHPFPNGATPVFFFDQFEEFFAAPRAAQHDFLTQLAELLCDQPPSRISERIAQELSSANPGQHASPSQRDDADKTRITELTAWGRQPIVKCVFAIRDDRLAELDSLESFIPLVLKNRYKLNALSGHSARLAIVEPAKAIGEFTTLPFSYADQNVPGDNSANTLQLIIDGLSNDKGEIDSTQLQMVCNNIEAAVEKALKNTPEKVTFESNSAELSLRVDKRLIPNAQTIDTFINEFYTTRLSTVGSAASVDLAGNVLESFFVLDGKRIGVDEPMLKQHLLGNEGLINKLVESRIIRPEPTSRGTAYELSHDKLVEPVEKARKNRDEKNKQKDRLRKTLIVSGIMISLLSVTIFYYFWSNKNKLDRSQFLLKKFINPTALIQYNSGKHYFAYRLWREIDSTDNHLFAPYVGKDIQADTNYHYVAALYGSSELEVRMQRKQLVDSIVFRTTASGFSLAGSKLATYIADTVSGYKVNITGLQADNFSLTLPQRAINLSGVTLSPDGSYAILIDVNSKAHLYHLSSKSVNETNNFFNLFKDEISLYSRKRRFVFNSSSTWLVVMDDNYQAFIYDILNQRKYKIITDERSNKVGAIKFSSDGNMLAIATRRYFDIYNLKNDPSHFAYHRPLNKEITYIDKITFVSNEKCVINGDTRVIIIDWVKNEQKYLETNLIGKSHTLGLHNGRYILQPIIQDSIDQSKPVGLLKGYIDMGFFSSNGKSDTHLITVYRNRVIVFNIKTNQLLSLSSEGNRFGRLSITGNLFRIQLGDRIELDDQGHEIRGNTDYLSFFVDLPKNQIDYMEKFVYPRLTKEQRDQFGLSK